MTMFDPYAELGVERDADEKTVRRAYRRRAKETHPDKKGGRRDKFESANRALMVLTDPKRREQYDRTGSVDDDKPDNAQAEALTILLGTLTAILDECDKVGRSPLQINIVEMLRANIDRAVTQGEASKKAPLKRIETLERVDRRLRKKGKPSLVNHAIAGQIAAIRATLAKTDSAILAHRNARALLDDHEFDVETIMDMANPPPWMTVAVR